MLDDYEAYADEYITMMKKANDDDGLDVLLGYPDLLEKAKKVREEFERSWSIKIIKFKPSEADGWNSS